jgi:hypothetical protein
VRTEFSRFHSQIDIAAARLGPNGFLLYLENKVWSGFGTKQLAREWEDLLLTSSHLRIPSARCRLVVLVPDKDTFVSPSNGIAAMTYEQLGAVVQSQTKVMSPDWRPWVAAWLEALPTQTSSHVRSARSDLSEKGDQQIFELLQRVAHEVAGAANDLPAEPIRLPGRGQAPSGQADLKLRWRSDAMQGVQLGVEWLWPEYLVSDRLGEQPRFWVWHKNGRSRDAGIVAAALKRVDSPNPIELERDERRRGYLYQEALPSYVPGELGFAAQLEDRLVDLFSSWARVLDTADQELAGVVGPKG